jgi:signal transduction histidine kinase/CheY-like chemotaxis protein
VDPGKASALVAALAAVEGRAGAARRLAAEAGAEALILLVHNAQVGRLLPAPGVRRTLPGGPAWKAFVGRCGEPGIHRGEVTALDRDEVVPVAACSNGRMAMLFVGGEVADAALQALSPTLPLLAELLQSQLAHDICQGELSAARFEMRQYASLARSLDEARAQLDATVRELGRQAQRLQEQRTRAEHATRAKDQFMAMLGHELRNPLAPIVTVLQVMRLRGQWSPEHAIMQRQVEHLQRLVDDLLDVSRIARGKVVLDRRVIEVADAIDTAHETAHPLIAHKHQQVELQVPRTGLPVLADPSRLAQVFANLLTNASKYSGPESRISVRAVREDGRVLVEVTDEGVGIAPGMLARVFDLFEQEASSLDRSQGGLGLGLSIVRNLVSQHGGEVEAHSEGPGHGSRFVVKLPLAHGQAADSPEDDAHGAGSACAGRRILLVDDNADALTTLSQALRLAGFVVGVAVDGQGALELARDFRPELAVLDIGLPGMDGYALAGALRDAFPQDPPRLVALTGYCQPDEKRKALERGFDAHLVKPVDFAQLQRVINELLVEARG